MINFGHFQLLVWAEIGKTSGRKKIAPIFHVVNFTLFVAEGSLSLFSFLFSLFSFLFSCFVERKRKIDPFFSGNNCFIWRN